MRIIAFEAAGWELHASVVGGLDLQPHPERGTRLRCHCCWVSPKSLGLDRAGLLAGAVHAAAVTAAAAALLGLLGQARMGLLLV